MVLKVILIIAAVLFITVPILCGVWRKYFLNVAIALDQFINVLFGGDPDETMSSRIGKALTDKDAPWIARSMAKLCSWVLNKIQKNHCKVSIEKDEDKDSLF